MPSISSSKVVKKERQSNIELLRIVAMLMVLVVHANYWRIGTPTPADVVTSPLPTFMRILIQHLASPCVDVFIIISGYFGMHPKWKSFFNLWFLLAFWGGVEVMYEGNLDLLHAGAHILFPFIGWFIPAYLGLYLISPILNQYADHAEAKFAAKFLIVFFVLQTFFESVYPRWEIYGRSIFNHGCSILSFVGLYLLGRFMKTHSNMLPRLTAKKWALCYAGVFGFSVLVIMLSCYLPSRLGQLLIKNATDNSSPVVIVGSLCLFKAFEGLYFSSRIINRVAASVLGVFCFHSMSFYAPVVKSIYANHEGVSVLLLDGAFIVLVYLLGTLSDQIRVLIWNGVSKYVVKQ